MVYHLEMMRHLVKIMAKLVKQYSSLTVSWLQGCFHTPQLTVQTCLLPGKMIYILQRIKQTEVQTS